jgi:hypothetical protein
MVDLADAKMTYIFVISVKIEIATAFKILLLVYIFTVCFRKREVISTSNLTGLADLVKQMSQLLLCQFR